MSSENNRNLELNKIINKSKIENYSFDSNDPKFEQPEFKPVVKKIIVKNTEIEKEKEE